MNQTQLILALITLGVQSTPKLVADIAALIHHTPRQANETEDAYVARLNADTEATIQQARAADAQVENG